MRVSTIQLMQEVRSRTQEHITGYRLSHYSSAEDNMAQIQCMRDEIARMLERGKAFPEYEISITFEQEITLRAWISSLENEYL